MQKQVSGEGDMPRTVVEPDNIDVETDVISNATSRRHGNKGGCTIGANY
jgi:hypothetical protein